MNVTDYILLYTQSVECVTIVFA